MRIYMQQRAAPDQAPRFYQICLERDLLEGWLIVKESGRIGSSGRVTREHYNSREDAETAMFSTRDHQVKKGFQIVFIQGDAGPAA